MCESIRIESAHLRPRLKGEAIRERKGRMAESNMGTHFLASSLIYPFFFHTFFPREVIYRYYFFYSKHQFSREGPRLASSEKCTSVPKGKKLLGKGGNAWTDVASAPPTSQPTSGRKEGKKSGLDSRFSHHSFLCSFSLGVMQWR